MLYEVITEDQEVGKTETLPVPSYVLIEGTRKERQVKGLKQGKGPWVLIHLHGDAQLF